MENIVLHHAKTDRYKDPLISNGFVLSNGIVYNEETSVEMTGRIEEGITPVAFYTEEKGAVFKVAAKSGHIFWAEKKNGYEWECVGDMDVRVLNTFFNQTSGSVIILTENEIVLLDRHFNMVRTEEYSDELKKLVQESPLKEIVHAEWSSDGKYILVMAASILSIYAYNLEPIADTITVCNRIMNSRLMQTKKYLLNECAYVDSMRRVSVSNDQNIEVQDILEKNSVVFEKRSSYKLATWHNRFSLIYAVTDNNSIHILERNGLKYKELFHLRECDRKEENIESNDIVCIRTKEDYMYIVNREGHELYLKVYYIKNNCLYLKVNQNIASVYTTDRNISVLSSAIKDMLIMSSHQIKLVLTEHIVTIKQSVCVNRTGRGVIDIDGARLIMYNLYKCPIPPPMYSREIKLEGVPDNLHALYNGEITYQVNGKIYSRVVGEDEANTVTEIENQATQADRTEKTIPMEERVKELNIQCSTKKSEYTTEIPSILNGHEIDLCGYKVVLTLNSERQSLHIQSDSSISQIIENVSSILPVITDQQYILISVKAQAWTEIYKLSLALSSNNTLELVQARVARTGKDSRIVFASEISIIMVDVYGMLETFYLGFMLENKIDKLVSSEELPKAVGLAKKHGLSISKYLNAISASITSNRIEAQTLFEIVKLLFNEDRERAKPILDQIEKYSIAQIDSILCLNAHSSETDQPNYVNDTKTINTIYSWCNIAVEIYLFFCKPELIVILAEKFTYKEIISPKSFFSIEQYAIPERIIKKCIGVISPSVLLQSALNVYAYTLCYIIMHATDTPHDETNDILLVGQSDRINPFCASEEIERRLKIAKVAKDKKKQTLYMIKQYILRKESANKECSFSITDLKLSIEKECIRDFYLYLLDINELCRGECAEEEMSSEIFINTTQSLLHISGDSLEREGDHKEALNCYLRAGNAAKDKVCSLRMKLGLWREFFSDKTNQTPSNIQRMEDILLSQKNILSAAELNLELGLVPKGLKYLVEIEEYKRVNEYISKDSYVQTADVLENILQKVRAYSESIQNTLEQYTQNKERLMSVRERKDKEREEIINGMYADDDCETVYTRSFITNTFLSSNAGNAKKKKRSSKLRNTVGGRYEEEYVQYVLSELILKTVHQLSHIQSIICISHSFRKKCTDNDTPALKNIKQLLNTLTDEISGYNKHLQRFYETVQITKEADFISQNTEDDVLYDPDRPIIEEPSTSDILAYITAIKQN
ncbi:hypothetical protein NEIG_01023 [Nematocida sp. ERTm5]|nr:hypothetical protein NEIG_01023 [Nematocida sp. ERTm5]